MYILVADDDPNQRLFIIRELEKEFSGLQVQEIVDENSFEQVLGGDRIDLAILDYQLRWTTGLDLLHRLKRHSPNCPVIMFTDTANQEIAVEAMKSGLDDYILKSPKNYIRLRASARAAVERTQSKQRAALLEVRFQALLEQLSIGVFRATPDHQVIEANQAFLQLLRISSLADEQIDQITSQLSQPTELAPGQKRERELQLTNEGNIVWIRLAETLNSAGGEAVIDGLVEDITEIKHYAARLQTIQEEERQRYTEQLEQEISRRTQELEEANKDLEAFTYSVSHDLREPLRSIRGYAQILLEDFADQLDSTGQAYADRIRENGDRMDQMLQGLLSYNRLSRMTLALQAIDLDIAVRDVLTQLELQLQHAQIIVEAPLFTVIGHYLTVEQVITNLITNAIKFVTPGVQPRIRIWSEPRSEFIRLWIEDNGIGIAPQHRDRIFRIFERLHGVESYPGTGIGLAIVQRSIERMGGRSGVESQVGQGSRFWIELPTFGE
ncbi:response regulator [Cyanobacteria bacterium FACHB-471]|nr:response regulator [Cyanobacteria bacterium FACHB-471]